MRSREHEEKLLFGADFVRLVGNKGRVRVEKVRVYVRIARGQLVSTLTLARSEQKLRVVVSLAPHTSVRTNYKYTPDSIRVNDSDTVRRVQPL